MIAKGFTTNNLIEAIRAGSLNDVIRALEDGDDIEFPDMHGCSGLPLRTACFGGNLAIVRELLKHGANPSAASCDGPGAPLRLALRKGHQDIADLLRQMGAALPGEIPGTPEVAATPEPLLPDEAIVPSLPANEPDNSIEFSTSSLPLPSGEASNPWLSESEPDNSIEFSFSDSDLPTDDDDTLSDFGSATKVLSMDLLFLDENETPEHASHAADKH